MMLPDGQTGEEEGGPCPQCGLYNRADIHYCFNCRYPLHTLPKRAAVSSDARSSGNGRVPASTAVKTAPPPVIERPRSAPPPQLRSRTPIPWSMLALSWGLLALAYGINRYALSIRDSAYSVMAFFIAMLAVGLASMLLRERTRLARASGWLLLIVYGVLQILAIRAALI